MSSGLLSPMGTVTMVHCLLSSVSKLNVILDLILVWHHLISKEAVLLITMYVFCRLRSQLAGVNTQSNVGMFHFYDVLHYSGCMFCTPLFQVFFISFYFIFISLSNLCCQTLHSYEVWRTLLQSYWSSCLELFTCQHQAHY